MPESLSDVARAGVSAFDVDPGANGFRLTTQTGTPIPTADRTAQSTLFLTPFLSNRIALFNGTRWVPRASAEVSLALTGLSNGVNYDVFASWSGSAVALNVLAWSGATTRATALVRQDGVWCRSGTLTQRWVGTIRTTGTTTTEDSELRRFVFNANNRVKTRLRRVDTSDLWTYAVDTFRSANNSTANRVELVCGEVGEYTNFSAFVLANQASSTTSADIAIGEDSTTTAMANRIGGRNIGLRGVDLVFPIFVHYETVVPVGYHFYQWLEKAAAATTFYGSNAGVRTMDSGILGGWLC